MNPVTRTCSWLLLLAGVLAGCQRDSDERLGLDERRQASFDPAALAAPGELEKALARPSAEVARQLGAYRLTQSARLTVGRGEHKGTLEESWKLESDGHGGLHLLHE